MVRSSKASTGSSRNSSEEESVWTAGTPSTARGAGDADDEQSYYTHYSAGSMGLAKRSNKELSLVGYVSLEDNETDSASAAPSEFHDAACDHDEEEDEEQQVVEERAPPNEVDDDDDEEYYHAPTSTSKARREEIGEDEEKSQTSDVSSPTNNKLPGILRRKQHQSASTATPGAAVKKNNPEMKDHALFDHSSSTHKARGAFIPGQEAVVSSSTSSSSHWRRGKPELSVITDVRDEEESSSQEQLQAAAEVEEPKMKKAEDLTDALIEENNLLDGAADTRSRRRERLSRLARVVVVNSPSSNKNTDDSAEDTAERTLSPSNHQQDGALSPSSNYSRGSFADPRGVASPSSLSRTSAVSPTTSRLAGSPRRRRAATERPISPPRVISPQQKQTTMSPTKRSSVERYASPPHQQQRNNSLSVEDYYGSPTKSVRNSSSVDRYASPPHQQRNNSLVEDYASPTKSVRKSSSVERYASPPSRKNSSIDHYGSPKSQQSAATQNAANPRHVGSSYNLSPQKAPRRNGSPPKTFFPEEDGEEDDEEDEQQNKPFMEKFLKKYHHKKHSFKSPSKLQQQQHQQWSPMGHHLSLPTVRETDGTSTFVSDNSSVLTHNLQEGAPCMQQFIQSARLLGKDANGNPCIGYTQKCTSFVTGVWKSCGISGYQTENKKSLLQLEMIAEQSVSSICKITGPGRTSPEAFRHSRNLLAKSNESHDDLTHHDSTEKSNDKDSGSSYKQLSEVLSDEATTHDDMNLPFGAWNVEEALTTLGAKMQEVVGLREDRRTDSMMEEMRNMFDSLSTYYTPNHHPYYGNDPAAVAPKDKNIFAFRGHGVTGGRSQPSSPTSKISLASTKNDKKEEQERESTIVRSPRKEPTTTVPSEQTDQKTHRGSVEQQQQQQQQRQQQHMPSRREREQLQLERQHHQPKREPIGAVASIYSSVAAAARNKQDRRTMFMELQRRRMKHSNKGEGMSSPKSYEGMSSPKSYEGNSSPQIYEDETTKLRNLYVGLYDKIHDEDRQEENEPTSAKVQEESSNVQVEEVQQTEVEQDHDQTGDDDDDEEEEEEEEDYAVVWAASEISAASPRHTVWAASENSMTSPRQTVWASNGEGRTSMDGGSLVDDDTNDDDDKAEDGGEYLDIEDDTDTELVVPTLPDKASLSVDAQRSRSCESPYADCKSVTTHHTRYLDAEEYGEDESSNKNDAEPQPDPTLSLEESPTRAMDESENVANKDFDDTAGFEDDDTAPLIPTIATGNSSTGSQDMDALVSSFLESRGFTMNDSSFLRRGDNSESSRSMVLLSEDSFQRVDSPTNCKSLEDLPEEGEEETPAEYNVNAEEDAVSVHSEDQTLADSTMVSGYSGSNHDSSTHDLSMAESIVSDGLRSRNSSRSDGTPDVSDVPPEIAQPLGPISEYQVLYQISEEDEEAEQSSDATGSSFEHTSDIPFDEDVSLEEYRRKSSVRQVFASICQWIVLGSMVYFYFAVKLAATTTTGSSSLLEETAHNTVGMMVKPAAAPIAMDSSRLVEERPVKRHSKKERKKPPTPLPLPVHDGITVVEDEDGWCHGVPFAVGESVPMTEAEAYRHTWALELQAALKEH